MGFNSSRDGAFKLAVLSNLHKVVDSTFPYPIIYCSHLSSCKLFPVVDRYEHTYQYKKVTNIPIAVVYISKTNAVFRCCIYAYTHPCRFLLKLYNISPILIGAYPILSGETFIKFLKRFVLLWIWPWMFISNLFLTNISHNCSIENLNGLSSR